MVSHDIWFFCPVLRSSTGNLSCSSDSISHVGLERSVEDLSRLSFVASLVTVHQNKCKLWEFVYWSVLGHNSSLLALCSASDKKPRSSSLSMTTILCLQSTDPKNKTPTGRLCPSPSDQKSIFYICKLRTLQVVSLKISCTKNHGLILI